MSTLDALLARASDAPYFNYPRVPPSDEVVVYEVRRAQFWLDMWEFEADQREIDPWL